MAKSRAKKQFDDKNCRDSAKRIAKDKTWRRMDRMPDLPEHANRYGGTPEIAFRMFYRFWETSTADHQPGDLVEPTHRIGKSRYRYYYIGSYSSGGGSYGAYRLLRSDGRETSASSITNLDRAKRKENKQNAVMVAKMNNHQRYIYEKITQYKLPSNELSEYSPKDAKGADGYQFAIVGGMLWKFDYRRVEPEDRILPSNGLKDELQEMGVFLVEALSTSTVLYFLLQE